MKQYLKEYMRASKTYSNGNRCVLRDTTGQWWGYIDDRCIAQFVADRNGSQEANAKAWVKWKESKDDRPDWLRCRE